MQYMADYRSPLGHILLAGDSLGLIGLWFAGQKYYAGTLTEGAAWSETPVLKQTAAWLDGYFLGKPPLPLPPLHLLGTPFQRRVWERLREIPYGTTVTYRQLARAVGCGSARAVGGAVSRNPISILVPCHRVVGVRGQLTGYAGGLERKRALLSLEQGEWAGAPAGMSDETVTVPGGIFSPP